MCNNAHAEAWAKGDETVKRILQNGIVVNKGAVDAKSAEKDNVAGTTVPDSKTAETTTVTAKAGDAVVTTTTKPTTPPPTKPEEKKDVVVVDKDGNVTVTAGTGVGGDGYGAEVNVTVNFGTINTNA